MRNNIIYYDVEYEKNANSNSSLSRNIAFVNQTIRFDCLYEDGGGGEYLKRKPFRLGNNLKFGF
jgi:hypothetical protein